MCVLSNNGLCLAAWTVLAVNSTLSQVSNFTELHALTLATCSYVLWMLLMVTFVLLRCLVRGTAGTALYTVWRKYYLEM